MEDASMRTWIVPSFLAALAASVFADPVVQIHDLALGAGLAGGDVEVVIDAGDAWLAGGICAEVRVPGVTFVYFMDPNTGYVVFTAPESSGSPTRAVTFVSLPRAQNANARFRTAGAASVVGPLCTAGPAPVALPGYYDVAYAEIPPTFTQSSGFTQRVVVDYADSAYAGETVYAASSPASASDVMLVRVSSAVATRTRPSPLTWQHWGIFATPEPTTLAMFVLAAAVRRRSGGVGWHAFAVPRVGMRPRSNAERRPGTCELSTPRRGAGL